MRQYTNTEIVKHAEQWASRFYTMNATGFLNWDMSDPQTGRYVVDLLLQDAAQWICMEVQVKNGTLVIPGGALITGCSSLADIHRRFN